METTDAALTEERHRGRPRDPSRDQAIIDASIDVLVRDGYDRLSMEGVAAAAGVGKATVYRRWGSKAELVIDAMATLKPAIDTIDTANTQEVSFTLSGSLGESETGGASINIVP